MNGEIALVNLNYSYKFCQRLTNRLRGQSSPLCWSII